MNRKLATIRKINDVKRIDGADFVCAYRLDGWWVVDSINKYNIGELVLYLETDSWVPETLAPFLCKGKTPREYNGVPGERLRTIKLRGQISQGLILPLTVLNPYLIFDIFEGQDVTEMLGIQKWEEPIPAQLQGMMKGNFPSWIRKTDQERIHNLNIEDLFGEKYQITMKLNGSSMSLYNWQDSVGVCSRNVDLKMDQEGNTFVTMAKSILYSLSIPDGLAIQGELMGPGIQGNPEGFAEHRFYVFDIWDINLQEYCSPLSVELFCTAYGLNHVPILGYASLEDMGFTKREDIIAYATGAGLNSQLREGVVFKSMDRKISFKAISNEWLMKNE